MALASVLSFDRLRTFTEKAEVSKMNVTEGRRKRGRPPSRNREMRSDDIQLLATTTNGVQLHTATRFPYVSTGPELEKRRPGRPKSAQKPHRIVNDALPARPSRRIVDDLGEADTSPPPTSPESLRRRPLREVSVIGDYASSYQFQICDSAPWGQAKNHTNIQAAPKGSLVDPLKNRKYWTALLREGGLETTAKKHPHGTPSTTSPTKRLKPSDNIVSIKRGPGRPPKKTRRSVLDTQTTRHKFARQPDGRFAPAKPQSDSPATSISLQRRGAGRPRKVAPSVNIPPRPTPDPPLQVVDDVDQDDDEEAIRPIGRLRQRITTPGTNTRLVSEIRRGLLVIHLPVWKLEALKKQTQDSHRRKKLLPAKELLKANKSSTTGYRNRTLKIRLQLPSHIPTSAPSSAGGSTPFLDDDEEYVEESDSEPYRGVITGQDADTSRTIPREEDKELFEDALAMVENSKSWEENEDDDDDDELHRTKKKKQRVAALSSTSSMGMTRISNIRKIHMAQYGIDTWYISPYPEEYSRHKILCLCEFCLKYMSSDYVAQRHALKCPYRHPPGTEIYRHEGNSIFEVDGAKSPLYCQNLCLMAKLFLDSKTLYYDVEPFMFYVLTENDDKGCHFVGYFSKQKVAAAVGTEGIAGSSASEPPPSPIRNNVSCIVTLPTAQRKGYGNFLIEFSYLLTRCEKTVGTPEKPLSTLGLASYTNYWKHALCYELRKMKMDGIASISIENMSHNTGMTFDDVVFGLETLGFLVEQSPDSYIIRVDDQLLDTIIRKWESKNYRHVHPEKLLWVPL